MLSNESATAILTSALQVGNFPYKSGDISGAASYSFSIPLASLGFSCPGDDASIYVAAHAALRKVGFIFYCFDLHDSFQFLEDGSAQTETGWADGTRFVDRGNWGTFFTVELTCSCDDGGEVGPPARCETAFAKLSVATCFLDIDEDEDGVSDFNRWGWTNGPLLSGTSYHLKIYAAAAQCDLTKGTEVGTAQISYQGTTVTVSFQLYSGFISKEVTFQL